MSANKVKARGLGSDSGSEVHPSLSTRAALAPLILSGLHMPEDKLSATAKCPGSCARINLLVPAKGSNTLEQVSAKTVSLPCFELASSCCGSNIRASEPTGLDLLTPFDAQLVLLTAFDLFAPLSCSRLQLPLDLRLWMENHDCGFVSPGS